jgi:1,4-dihydroxy-6-naphthoate synthase
MSTQTRRLSLAHSPDSDDAFMFYGLASGHVPTGALEIEHVLCDIETLNRAAREERHDVTAISFHAWPYVAERYALMPCGGSIGDGYGPLLVSRQPLDEDEVKRHEVAVPGTLTSAYLALQLFAPGIRTRVVPFDQILDEVSAGRAEVGLIIHEGQLTFGGQGLHRVLDLGEWWKRTTSLPLPLGGNAVRRGLGTDLMRQLTGLVRDTVRYSLAHRAEALQYAMGFARGMDPAVADRFVGMWVNEMTVESGEVGRRAVQTFLDRGHEAGVIPMRVQADFVDA